MLFTFIVCSVCFPFVSIILKLYVPVSNIEYVAVAIKSLLNCTVVLSGNTMVLIPSFSWTAVKDMVEYGVVLSLLTLYPFTTFSCSDFDTTCTSELHTTRVLLLSVIPPINPFSVVV